MNLLASGSRNLMLLAPSEGAVPAAFVGARCDPSLHHDLLDQTQKFRGRVYLEDGAIKPSQLIDGGHRLDVDQSSWHLLVVDPRGRVCGCARYKEYPAATTYRDLSVSRSSLAKSTEWGQTLKGAVDAELALCRRLNYPPAEWGGWALDEEIRGTAEALRMALAAYGLTAELGGAAPFSCATRRHGSASILRRIGGKPLEYCGLQLPAYYDDQYQCEMEILQFISWAPNPRYDIWIQEGRMSLRSVPVLTNGAAGPEWVASMRSRLADDLMSKSAFAG